MHWPAGVAGADAPWRLAAVGACKGKQRQDAWNVASRQAGHKWRNSVRVASSDCNLEARCWARQLHSSARSQCQGGAWRACASCCSAALPGGHHDVCRGSSRPQQGAGGTHEGSGLRRNARGPFPAAVAGQRLVSRCMLPQHHGRSCPTLSIALHPPSAVWRLGTWMGCASGRGGCGSSVPGAFTRTEWRMISSAWAPPLAAGR